eukprot:TRINITY_DN5132_c1_g1_i5.p1 TRINITY_DN5132_c1_g1~~TRINITY_DN5132_c1_g1_i5.p1  ORF type:complete len:588 (+),score=138.13 TRINITY_DN5132_c1_g1_i5:99-1766(+)
MAWAQGGPWAMQAGGGWGGPVGRPAAGSWEVEVRHYRVGQIVEATGRLATDGGRVVERGMRGVVTSVPGGRVPLEPGAVAEVCINGVTFDAQPDMIRPLPERPRGPPPPPGPSSQRVIRRPDPSNPGDPTQYTREEFELYYGSNGLKMWKKAGVALKRVLGPLPHLVERQVAAERKEQKQPSAKQQRVKGRPEVRKDPSQPGDACYTKDEFLEYYGEKLGEAMWKKAAPPAAESATAAGGTEEVTVCIERETAQSPVGWTRLKDGLVITGVSDGSPAALAGVCPGWAICSIGGQTVDSDERCMAALREADANFTAVLERKVTGRRPRRRVICIRIKRDDPSERLGWVRPAASLTISEVLEDSPAARAGVQKRWQILEIAGRPVSNASEAAAALAEAGKDFVVCFSRPAISEETVTVRRNDPGQKVGWTRYADSLVIEAVEQGSPAEAAGIRKKWRILAIGDTAVSTPPELIEALRQAGCEFSVTLTRRQAKERRAGHDLDELEAEVGSPSRKVVDYVQGSPAGWVEDPEDSESWHSTRRSPRSPPQQQQQQQQQQ